VLLVISIGCVFGVAHGWWYYVGGTLVAAFLNALVMLLCYFWGQSFEDSFVELSHTVYFVVSLFISAILLFAQPNYETAPWKHYVPTTMPTTTAVTTITSTTTANITTPTTTAPITTPATTTGGHLLLKEGGDYSKEGAFIAGGVFCLFLCLSYAAELYLLIMRLLNHRGRPAPPTHVSNQNATDLPSNIPVASQPGA
ncbi:unnamed protein product, partial [Meganyctiphanes norvegica]